MAKFYVKNFMGNKITRQVKMPSGSTPNQFRELIKLNVNVLPTVCKIERKGMKPFYLSRNKEWDEYKVSDYESCTFVVYPNATAGFGEALLVSLIVSLVVGVATYLLTPKPDLGVNQLERDVSPTYDLTQQGNRVRLNQAKPIHYGTIRAYPDIWSNPWTESVGNQRIYHALLNMGYNYIEIDDYRIDDTDLTSFPTWVDINVRFPGDSPTSLFPKPMITSKEVQNIKVEDVTSEYYVLNDPNPISLCQDIHLDFVNPRGIYYSGGINDRGTADVATDVNINLASLPATIDGVVPTDFLVFRQLNSPDNGWWVYTGVGLAATRHVNMNDVAEFQNGSVFVNNGTFANKRFRNIVRITSMADPKLFVDWDSDLEINETAVWIRIVIQEIDYLGADVNSPITQYHKIQAAKNEPYYTTFDYSHGYPARLKVEVTQGYMYTTDPTYTENFVDETSYETLSGVMNMTEWIGLRGEMDIAESVNNYQTLIEIQIQASGKLNNSNIGIFNFLGKARIPVYDFGTSTWSIAQTNSPIWAWYDIITNKKYGMALSGVDYTDTDYVDLNNLEDIYDSINSLGLECNTRFDTAMPAREMLAQICQSMRCITYERGGRYYLARAEEKTSINGFFSRENIKEGSLSIELVPKNDFTPTWFRVTYYDSVTSKKETVDCVIPSSLTPTQQYAEPFEEIELHTITDRTKAWQYGMYLVAQSKWNNERIRFETDMEGFFPNPMDFISVSHPMLTSTQSGYIQKVDGAIVYLSEPIAFNGYETGLISFKNLDGTCTPYYICKPCTNQFCVEMVEFDTATENYTAFPFLSQEDEPLTEETTFTFGVTESSMIVIVSKIDIGSENSATLECVNHDPRVFTADKPVHLVPELGGDYVVHDEFRCDAIDCKVNIATKEITVRWDGSGYNTYTIRYLFTNLGVESTVIQVVPQGVAGTHTDTYIYTGNPPSQVTVHPWIDITISPPAIEELTSLKIIVPIEII